MSKKKNTKVEDNITDKTLQFEGNSMTSVDLITGEASDTIVADPDDVLGGTNSLPGDSEPPIPDEEDLVPEEASDGDVSEEAYEADPVRPLSWSEENVARTLRLRKQKAAREREALGSKYKS